MFCVNLEGAKSYIYKQYWVKNLAVLAQFLLTKMLIFHKKSFTYQKKRYIAEIRI
ncbi:hypothetical protein FDUTEX481_07544 [Tolypothrix sp. PCC 7601]|nr:hypothetical protein FDUTEX481_07544 [Tolypothrix sp. PCC 7601]BAY89366.1 hypothetical protein NIES3275_13690 [Microchaete diplosiphon NIES-3275]